MPGYGVSTDVGELLPWSWALERLSASRRYWVATIGADGAPHIAAVWAIWFDGSLVFSTGGGSAKARNLGRDPRCTVTTERADESVVLRGAVRRVIEPVVIDAISERYVAKYGSGFPDAVDNPLFAVAPSNVIGVEEVAERFARTATRWVFGES